MDKLKITVMIPVYNMKGVIGRAIESVLAQDYENKELMVLDGGSTDGTIEVIKNYIEDIDYFVSQTDGGPSEAMASNLSYATGDYIALLGADDFYEEGALSAAAATIKVQETDVAFGDCNFLYPDGRILRKSANRRGLENLYYYCSLFSNAAFVKKELLESYYSKEWMAVKGIIDVSTDHLLWLVLYHNGKKFSYIPSERALTNYAVSGRSSINEFTACMDDAHIIRLVLDGDVDAQEKYMPEFNRYFAARTLIFYEKVMGEEAFGNKLSTFLNEKKNYVIFGIGDMSRKVLRLLKLCGTEPKYFVDNNAGINSSLYLGYKVYPPEKLVEASEVVVIISVLGNETAIRKQMQDMQLKSSVEFLNYSDLALEIQTELGTEILEKGWKKGILM